MSIFHKRLLYTFFIFLFFVINPIILLYSSGFRFNYKKFTIEKTGSAVIVSFPKKAKVYINNTATKYTTPAKIRFLIPDTYSFSLQKEGYYPWSRSVAVESSLTSFLKDINLVKKNKPKLIMGGKIDWMEKIPRQNAVIFLNNSSTEKILMGYDPSDGELKKIMVFQKNDSVETVDWSNNKKLLVKSSKGNLSNYYVINTDTWNIIKLKLPDIEFQKIKWDRLNNDIMYGLSESQLFQIDSASGIFSVVLADAIDDYITEGSNVYYTASNASESYLKKIILFSKEYTPSFLLPSRSHYSLDLNVDKKIEVKDDNNYYLIDPEVFLNENADFTKSSLLILQKEKNIEWSKNFKNILLYDDSKIFTYNVKTETKNIMKESNEPILKAFFAFDDNYVFYWHGESFSIIENTQEGRKNAYTLGTFNEVQDVLINNRDQVFFTAQEIGKEGLYEMYLN